MKLHLVTLLIWALTVTGLQAQSVTVSGRVTDQASGETLIGVNVVEVASGIGTATNLDGEYSFSLSPGTVTIEVSYTGYEKQQRIVELKAGQNMLLNFDLQVQTRLMNQLVVSGSRFEKKLGEETVSMEVIQPRQIAAINAVQIDDALERVPGVNVLDGQVNIRAGAGYSYGAGTRVLLLYNDMPILQADAGFPNWSAVPIENIGQVEIIKGAASALYGSSAINGIINLRSAEPKTKPYISVSTFGTMFNNPAGGTDSNGVNKAWWSDSSIGPPHEVGLSMAYRKKFGQFDLTAGAYFFKQQSFRAGEFDRRGRISLLTRYRFKKVDGLAIGLNLNTQYGKSGSFFIWNGLGADSYRYWETIGEPTQTTGFRVTIDPFVTYFDDRGNRHRLQMRYNQVDNDNTNDQGNFSKYYYGEYQFQRRFEDINFSVTSGVVANYVTVSADLYADSVKVEDAFIQVGDPLDGSNFAGYVQLDKKFFDKLNISLGGRLEANKISFTESEQKFVFRAGANYQVAEFTYLRSSWGQGYRFPTIAEKFIETALGGGMAGILNPAILPNPDLISETGWNTEIGIKQGIRIGSFDALVDVAVFYQQYQDMMEFVFFQPTPLSTGFQSRNIGDTRILGTELTIGGQGKVGKHPVNLVAGYTFANPKYQDYTPEIDGLTSSDENVLTYRNRHTFKGETDITVGRVLLGTNIQYYSFMQSIDKIFEILLPGVQEFRAANDSGDWIWDLRAGVDIGESFHVAAIVKNVMNREYAIRPARMDAPRNYTLRLTYTIGD